VLVALRGWLQAHDAAAAFISDPVSIAYLTGFLTDPHERLMALVVRQQGAVLVVPGLEQESASQAARGVTVEGWRDGEDPWRLVGGALGALSGRLAVEKGHLTLRAWDRLQGEVRGELQSLDVAAEIRRMRARKRPEELASLERAARITGELTRRLLEAIRPGSSELEVASSIALLVAEAGASLSFETIVQSGPNSAQPHLRPGDRRLQEGDLLLVDWGAAQDGYKADISRMAVVGEPSQRQREVHAVVLAANRAGVAAVRSGVTAGSVDAAARRVIEEAGFGEYFIHRTGHGLGLEAHEDPSLDPGSGVVLEAGMVVTIEPGVYIPGWGGGRIEDDVVVEESGGRVLTGADRGLNVIATG
jgi:Xaa-Pro dipeptidase